MYPNSQNAATLFYHDHALAITCLNLYAGLSGAYLLTDAHEASLPLPKGKFDIPLIQNPGAVHLDIKKLHLQLLVISNNWGAVH